MTFLFLVTSTISSLLSPRSSMALAVTASLGAAAEGSDVCRPPFPMLASRVSLLFFRIVMCCRIVTSRDRSVVASSLLVSSDICSTAIVTGSSCCQSTAVSGWLRVSDAAEPTPISIRHEASISMSGDKL